MGLRDIKPFGYMWRLINGFNRGAPGVFPPELVVGICWHESRFQNIGQIFAGAGQKIGGHGTGFGQVEPLTIDSINHMYKTHYPVGSPLTDQQSVELVGMTLLQALEAPRRKSKVAALHLYATGDIRHLRHPGPTVQGWLNCEEELKFLRFGAPPNFRDPVVIARIRTALLHAVPASSPQELDFAVRTET